MKVPSTAIILTLLCGRLSSISFASATTDRMMRMEVDFDLTLEDDRPLTDSEQDFFNKIVVQAYHIIQLEDEDISSIDQMSVVEQMDLGGDRKRVLGRSNPGDDDIVVPIGKGDCKLSNPNCNPGSTTQYYIDSYKRYFGITLEYSCGYDCQKALMWYLENNPRSPFIRPTGAPTPAPRRPAPQRPKRNPDPRCRRRRDQSTCCELYLPGTRYIHNWCCNARGDVNRIWKTNIHQRHLVGTETEELGGQAEWSDSDMTATDEHNQDRSLLYQPVKPRELGCDWRRRLGEEHEEGEEEPWEYTVNAWLDQMEEDIGATLTKPIEAALDEKRQRHLLASEDLDIIPVWEETICDLLAAGPYPIFEDVQHCTIIFPGVENAVIQEKNIPYQIQIVLDDDVEFDVEDVAEMFRGNYNHLGFDSSDSVMDVQVLDVQVFAPDDDLPDDAEVVEDGQMLHIFELELTLLEWRSQDCSDLDNVDSLTCTKLIDTPQEVPTHSMPEIPEEELKLEDYFFDPDPEDDEAVQLIFDDEGDNDGDNTISDIFDGGDDRRGRYRRSLTTYSCNEDNRSCRSMAATSNFEKPKRDRGYKPKCKQVKYRGRMDDIPQSEREYRAYLCRGRRPRQP